MNASHRSLEDEPSKVTNALLAFPLLFRAISTSSMVKEDSEEASNCDERSNSSRYKGLFLNPQVVYHLMEAG